jgi:hypothetical protein
MTIECRAEPVQGVLAGTGRTGLIFRGPEASSGPITHGGPKLQSRLSIDGRERPRIRSEDHALHDGSRQWRGHLRIEARGGGARRYGHSGGQHQRDEHSTHDSILFLRDAYNATSHLARYKAATMRFRILFFRRGGDYFIDASRTRSRRPCEQIAPQVFCAQSS